MQPYAVYFGKGVFSGGLWAEERAPAIILSYRTEWAAIYSLQTLFFTQGPGLF